MGKNEKTSIVQYVGVDKALADKVKVRAGLNSMTLPEAYNEMAKLWLTAYAAGIFKDKKIELQDLLLDIERKAQHAIEVNS